MTRAANWAPVCTLPSAMSFFTCRTPLTNSQNAPQRPPAAPAGAQPAVGPRRARTPAWGLAEAGIGTTVAEIHRGDCWARGRALLPVSEERARAELVSGTQACTVCRPDTVLVTTP
ncbi:DUF6233 domain-containing protein [Streptomyces sp. CNS654]|uniref:DUF6233 domain-containing protein n=1 Tax=Streptomyces sp. CNS654 TaxID=1506995 RepID=UPI000A941DDA|nr:DUF6233 domain-containing protein [Streptomyces sp. CNS654]